MLRSIRNVKLLKCVSLICLSPLFVFYSSLMLMQNLEAQTRYITGDEKVANRVVGIVPLKISLQDCYKRGHPVLAATSMFS